MRTPYAIMNHRDIKITSASEWATKKITERETTIDKACNVIVENTDRIAIVVAEEIEQAKMIAKTIFLLEALPPKRDIILVFDFIHATDSQLSKVLDDYREIIAYSALDGLSQSSFDINGKFQKDEYSITGLIYTGGGASPEISNYSALLALASSVVSCCYGGHGVQAGVDWKSSIFKILSNAEGLKKMVTAASIGLVDLPDKIPQVHMPKAKLDMLSEFFIRSEFSKSSMNPKKIVDVFTVRIVEGGDVDLVKAAKNMQAVEKLWKDVPATFDEKIMIADINPDSTNVVERINSVGEQIGVKSYIEAYLMGIPLEDLFA